MTRSLVAACWARLASDRIDEHSESSLQSVSRDRSVQVKCPFVARHTLWGLSSWTGVTAKAEPKWGVMKYKVALKKSKEGYSVSCPGLQGCWSQGKTEQEALENIQHAIREYFGAVATISKGSKIREVDVLV